MHRAQKHSRGMDGYLNFALRLLERTDDENAFVCLACTDSGFNRKRANLRSANCASNFYAHFEQVHPELYSAISLIIKGREKKQHGENLTISETLARSRQHQVDDALLGIFSSSEIPSTLIENARFQAGPTAIDP